MRDKAPKHKGRGGAKKSHGVFDFFQKKKLCRGLLYSGYQGRYSNCFFVNIFTQRENKS